MHQHARNLRVILPHRFPEGSGATFWCVRCMPMLPLARARAIPRSSGSAPGAPPALCPLQTDDTQSVHHGTLRRRKSGSETAVVLGLTNRVCFSCTVSASYCNRQHVGNQPRGSRARGNTWALIVRKQSNRQHVDTHLSASCSTGNTYTTSCVQAEKQATRGLPAVCRVRSNR